MYLLCRSFKKLPSEIDEEDNFHLRFLLEGLKVEKKIIEKKQVDIKNKMG